MKQFILLLFVGTLIFSTANAQLIKKKKVHENDLYAQSLGKTNKGGLKISATRLVVGCSVMGASGGAYMIGAATIESKINDITTELNGGSGTAENRDKINSLNDSKRTLGIVCGTTSIIGAIIAISSISRDRDGSMIVSKKMRLGSKANDLSLAWKF